MSEPRPSALRRPPWLRRVRHKHRSALRGAARQLLGRPFAHLFAVSLLALALFALLLLKLGTDQFQRLGSPLAGARSLSLFLSPSADAASARLLAQELAGDNRVLQVDAISPAEGLAELVRLGGSEDALAALPDNPLPWVLAVEPINRQAGADLAEAWRSRPEVEYLADEHDWQSRADTVLVASKALAWVLVVVIGLAAVLLAANAVRTIRIEGADERALQRVFGATEADLRRPYVYLGLLYGLLAGLVAVGLVIAVMLALAPTFRAVAEIFIGEPAHPVHTMRWLVLSIPAAGVLGALGAWLGCRFERDVEAIE